MANKLRRTIGGSLAALALSGAAVATVPPAASADPVGVQTITAFCGQNVTLITPGGVARATFRCADGVLRIRGTVQDTEADGRCAQVRVRYPGGDWKNSQPACPRGEVRGFGWDGPDPKAEIDIFTFAV